MNKKTMQDIADELSTSRISVWKALNNRTGVSKELRAQIFKIAEESGYLRGREKISANIGEKNLPARTVAAVVSRPQSSVFWTQIIHHIAKDLSDRGINLMYTYMPSSYKEGYTLPASLNDGSVNGMIVLNVYSAELLKLLSNTSTPKVFLDSVPSVPFYELNGDLVLLEGRCAIKEITSKLLHAGRTRLGFMGDVNYAQTNLDRYRGFLDAFKEFKINPDPDFSMTGQLHLRTHYEEICSFLDSLETMPDGFVCASDYIAHFVERYFSEHKIPRGDIVLTGFDNNLEYANVAEKITTVDVQTHTMGGRLASKIIFAMDNPNASREVSYVNSEILYRSPL